MALTARCFCRMASSLLRNSLYSMPHPYPSPIESPLSSTDSTSEDAEEYQSKASSPLFRGSGVIKSDAGIAPSRKEGANSLHSLQSESLGHSSSAFASTKAASATDSTTSFPDEHLVHISAELEAATADWYTSASQPLANLSSLNRNSFGTPFMFPFATLGPADMVHLAQNSGYLGLPFYTALPTGSADVPPHQPAANWYQVLPGANFSEFTPSAPTSAVGLAPTSFIASTVVQPQFGIV